MNKALKKIISYVAAMVTVMCVASCGGGSEEEQAAAARELEKAQLSELLRPVSYHANPYDFCCDSMPGMGRKMHINYLGGTLGRVFNDSNYKQMAEAYRIGLRRVETTADAWHLRRPVVKIESCKEYYVDQLTHSLPYLVPEAASLLKDIGAAFNDSLMSRGGGAYRVKVTSVLRTPVTVKRLRRRNVNAVERSAHLHGTTFDISYSKFICDNDSLPRTQEDLKNLLGEVLYDMREAGRCYVKYERKQACFHITARGAQI